MHTVQPETIGLSSSRLERIRPAMQSFIDKGQIAGISTLVYRQGQVAWFACQGAADLASNTPLAPDALYRIYSMTKPITAVAAMMLWEKGLFGLNDPVSAYIPCFAKPSVLVGIVDGELRTEPAAREVTIHDLFAHTSGLSYEFQEDELAQLYRDAHLDAIHYNTTLTTESMIDLLGQQPLGFHPGASWRYSYAQDVLGRLIEVVSGKSFGAYLREQIFEPLGMIDTDFWAPEDKIERLTTLYAPDGEGGITPVDGAYGSMLSIKRTCESGGGGLLSTMADYLKFARLLLGQGQVDGVRLLSRKTMALMASNHLTPPQLAAFQADGRPGQGYGLGMSVTLDPALGVTHCSAGDFGWGGAASTRFRIDPEEQMIVLAMPQLIQNPGYPFIERFTTLAYAALM